ncbi:ABC transporter B family protein [Melia azedarach]|uniref:ABC transporter B family protein n=1 Tax=Melia azedarach TaxID=155640 RepID=A0ACC1XA39_MELAZ|nr:ABC transporter B family protein [Melia azedarach]
MDKEGKGIEVKHRNGSFRSIFMHADGIDRFLMALGFIGSVGSGSTTPVVIYVSGKLMNSIGNAQTLSTDVFTHNINKNALFLVYIACAGWVVAFLGERQATRMRARYLKAVLRQDVGYFDMHVTSTAEVITSISNDSLVIQDVISEKFPNFLKEYCRILW